MDSRRFQVILFGRILHSAVQCAKKLREIFATMQENNLRRITYHSTIIFSPLILYWGLSVFVTLAAILYAMSKDTVAGRNVETFASAVQEMSNEPEILAAIDSQNEKILVNNSKTPT